MAPPSLDYWRGFFRGTGASIFDAIEAAILVAAADHPATLRARRDAIAERLYTSLIVSSTPPPPPPAGPVAEPPPAHLLPEGAASVPSICSSDRAEAITDDGPVPGDDLVVAEAERIKAVLLNDQEKSEAALLDLLLRLKQLEFTMKDLEVTNIGKAVSSLKKHGSKQIKHLVRSLILRWKAIVDEWMSTKDATVDHTPQSMDPSGLEQEERGLHSPMDNTALFATPSTSILLSEEAASASKFDGMPDDANIRNNGKEGFRHCPANQELVRKQPFQQEQPMGQRYDPEPSWRQEQSVPRHPRPHEPINGQTRQQFAAGAQAKPLAAQRRPQSTQPDKPVIHHDENSFRAKLELAKNAKMEATRRKLQEGYQEFDNAKKQRTIQMVDPQDLPKQGNRNWQPNPSAKPRNNSNNFRNWSSLKH